MTKIITMNAMALNQKPSTYNRKNDLSVVIKAVEYIKAQERSYPIHFCVNSESLHIGKSNSQHILTMFFNPAKTFWDNNLLSGFCEGIYEDHLYPRYLILPKEGVMQPVVYNADLGKMLQGLATTRYTSNRQVNMLIENLLKRDEIVEAIVNYFYNNEGKKLLH